MEKSAFFLFDGFWRDPLFAVLLFNGADDFDIFLFADAEEFAVLHVFGEVIEDGLLPFGDLEHIHAAVGFGQLTFGTHGGALNRDGFGSRLFSLQACREREGSDCDKGFEYFHNGIGLGLMFLQSPQWKRFRRIVKGMKQRRAALRRIGLALLGANPDLLGIGEFANAVRAKLAPVARLFNAATGEARIGFDQTIHHDLAGFKGIDK